MTGKQIEEARKNEGYIPYGELSCREMINSCLIYHNIEGGRYAFYRELNWCNETYASPYIKRLGKKRVDELFEEQVEDFKKAKVYVNVGCDSEGVWYNSIRWADELNLDEAI